jgi:type I restriction enzyme S subunit
MTSSLRFSDVAELRNEKVDPATCSGSRYVGLEHIEQESLSLSGWGTAEDVDSQKQRFYEGDILFGKLRPYFRKVVIAPFDGICSTDIWVVKPVIASDRDFVFYWMASDDFITRATNASEGTRMPRAKWDWVSCFELPETSLENRQIVGRILRALDIKVSVNRSISKTLEDLAQTIYKSWFIDFDPVKAKMAGDKPVGMDDATAALFPDLMEDSELGQIPTGWNWGSVGDVAQVIDCLHSKKPELVHQGQPYLQLDTIHDDGILRFERAAQISDADYQKWTSRIEVHDGDCVITNVGRVGAVSQVPCHFKGAIGRNITAIRPTDGKNSKTFLAIALTSSFMKREIRTNTDSGTILEALNVRSIPKLRLPIASAQIFELFEELCGPMQAQRHNLHRQNVQLAGLRDSLLPRLISGELQIPEEMLVS